MSPTTTAPHPGAALADLGAAVAISPDAPFTGEQRAWLSGFYAALAGGYFTADDDGSGAPATTVQVLYGTQTGNAQGICEDLAAAAAQRGLGAVVRSLDDVPVTDLAQAAAVVVVCSTYGEGDMPDNAELFWEAVTAEDAPRLGDLAFAVLALGDSGYDDFCQAGRLLDMRFEQLGARRLVPRVDCDVDFEDAASAWCAELLDTVVADPALGAGSSAPAPAGPAPGATPRARSRWTRRSPYRARVAVNRVLSAPGSAKEIRHYEIDLAGSGLEYEAGDALGVVGHNDPALVEALVEAVGASPDAVVDGSGTPLADLLATAYEIRTPSKDLLAEVASRTSDEDLATVLRSPDRAVLDAWLWGRDTLDVLRADPGVGVTAGELVALLRPLQHRSYSISSSPNAVGESVHLTVASVRYDANGRRHGGVCSTFLADRLGGDPTVDVFPVPNQAFRVPADDDVPIVMVGPGTGVAPFRAFLQERRARGATGRNWLFFGDQHRATDFVYADELEPMAREGFLTHLDLAFSRDQAEKVYVQSRMAARGADLFAWLEEGAHFYVCGDAGRMARDVDDALRRVVAEHGAMDAEAADEYVADLRRARRYVRDVY